MQAPGGSSFGGGTQSRFGDFGGDDLDYDDDGTGGAPSSAPSKGAGPGGAGGGRDGAGGDAGGGAGGSAGDADVPVEIDTATGLPVPADVTIPEPVDVPGAVAVIPDDHEGGPGGASKPAVAALVLLVAGLLGGGAWFAWRNRGSRYWPA